ncbi:MAG: cob(I)yrinic acid a,c-diamide adenosyltransferase [Eubacterium sp.]|nr:cob(I)yrinic acid a,c-diamide adenosyltransferase [Eubacterium sp.]MDD7208501.1 cob(I)yrinic acid a,c-diamide adenosyltransferase [Lachnospiraceae bacterium]MDY5497624.1 cob(I)yrinic acid a,c-diamide adenosyltransferase [Anaerobutyricum sp.]
MEKKGCGGLCDDHSGKGLVHIYCGDGKGKTTCSVGLMMRAAGSGKKILYHQFLKGNQSSERKIIESRPEITVIPGKEMEKFTFQMDPEELGALKKENDAMLDRLFSMAKDFDMLVMDESVYAIDGDLLDEKKMIKYLEEKPYSLEVVLTGRNPSQALMEHADYISEIQKVKHPFDQGVSSRMGIEK